MNWTQLHLLINHIPFILTLVGTLAAVYGLVRPRRSIWMYAVVSLVLAGIAVVPAYLTGASAADWVHRPWYVVQGSFQEHQASARQSAMLTGATALVALIAWRRLIRYPRETLLPGLLRGAVTLFGIASSAAIVQTAWQGQKITHDSQLLVGPPATRGAASPGRPSELGATTR